MEKALIEIWARLELEARAGSPTLLHFRQAVKAKLCLQLPTYAMQAIHKELTTEKSWSCSEAQHTRHGTPNRGSLDLVPLLMEAMAPHEFRGKVVSPGGQWDKKGIRSLDAMRRGEHPAHETAKLKHDKALLVQKATVRTERAKSARRSDPGVGTSTHGFGKPQLDLSRAKLKR